MAAGWPTKANYATGDVLSATNMNDLSGTVNLINPSAKGDLYAGSAANTYTKLSVGANNTVLTADSTTATGLKWAAASSGLSAATQAEMEAASSTSVATTPGRQQYHPSAAKFWVYYTGTGTPTIQVSYGVSSITDNGTGVYTVNLTTAFSTAAYALMGGADKLSGASGPTTLVGTCFSGAYNTNSFLQQVYDLQGTLVDSARVFCVGFGDQ